MSNLMNGPSLQENFNYPQRSPLLMMAKTYEGNPVLYYTNRANENEEFSSVPEVRQWVNQTILHQAINTITPNTKRIHKHSR